MADNTQTAEVTQPEIEADLAERVEGFNKELMPLLGKYELGFTSTLFITQDGRIGAKPGLSSARKFEKPTAEVAETALSQG